ncbi:hypothetical protein [Spiroplasma endosymbiont of Glossina fuscipes fuscipes]|uniref:hypothetical protein n=2 Tax=Spiroplasma endosymbiont of Glossina fuscipes fuscipes TaxID=2004463 RepID=UPI003CF10F81
MMKKLLTIFNIILIAILPVKITVENFVRTEVQTNKHLDVTKVGEYTKNRKLFINNKLFYYKNYNFNKEKEYSIDSKKFKLFLKNLVNNIKLFLEENPNVNLMDKDQLIDSYISYLKNEKHYGVTAFENFWWGFKWWITWESFITTFNNAGNNIARDSISSISTVKLAGYVAQFLAIKYPWVLAIPKIGLIIGGTLGVQVAGCLLGRQFWLKTGIIFRMIWFPPIMTGCWDQ